MKKFWALGALLMALATSAYADSAPAKSSLISLDVTKQEISTVFQGIEKQGEVTILVDGGVTGNSNPLTLDQVSVDTAVKMVCVGNGLTMQKAMIPTKQVSSVSTSKLKSALDAFKIMDDAGYNVVVMDSAGKKGSAFSAAVNADDLQAGTLKNSDYKTVYLITKAVAAKTPSSTGVRSFLDDQKSAFEELGQLSPDQQKQAIQQMLELMKNGDTGINWSAVQSSLKAYIGGGSSNVVISSSHASDKASQTTTAQSAYANNTDDSADTPRTGGHHHNNGGGGSGGGSSTGNNGDNGGDTPPPPPPME